MESKILLSIGIDPAYLIALLFLIQLLLLILLISCNMKYNRLKTSYLSFMKGTDAKNLEESFKEKFSQLDEIEELIKKQNLDLYEMKKNIKKGYQKTSIVRYNAFHEMEGNISFVLTMLDENNNGWVMNVMHNHEGCYTYVKEVINGKSFIQLSKEEEESLERAIFQEVYDFRDANIELK